METTNGSNRDGDLNGNLNGVINGVEALKTTSKILTKVSTTSSTTCPKQSTSAPAFEFWSYEVVKESTDWIRQRAPDAAAPEIAVVCGSGCGGVANSVIDATSFDFRDIPHFTATKIPGHKGRLILGRIGSRPVVVMQGRFHAYEGHHYGESAFPIRVMGMLGAKTVIITMATGGLNPEYFVGDFMVVKDHLSLTNLTGANPLYGPNDDRLGPRFVSLNNAYDRELRERVRQIADRLPFKSRVREGNYAHISGPNYETPMECRFLRLLGADAVGMSNAHECITARHMDMKVLSIALITNNSILEVDDSKHTNHEEVLEAGKRSGPNLKVFVEEIIAGI